MTQITFDIDELIREADRNAAPAWDGAPLQYHEDYYSPAELVAAWDRYVFEHGSFASVPNSHMWHTSSYRHGAEIGIHTLALFSADTRCDGIVPSTRTHQHAPGDLPGGLLTQAICEPCQWHHIGEHGETVHAWFDHAYPIWRELPRVPEQLLARAARGEKKASQRLLNWVLEHYPAHAQFPGAPIVTEARIWTRKDGSIAIGRGAIGGRSPFGGYSLSF